MRVGLILKQKEKRVTGPAHAGRVALKLLKLWDFASESQCAGWLHPKL